MVIVSARSPSTFGPNSSGIQHEPPGGTGMFASQRFWPTDDALKSESLPFSEAPVICRSPEPLLETTMSWAGLKVPTACDANVSDGVTVNTGNVPVVSDG